MMEITGTFENVIIKDGIIKIRPQKTIAPLFLLRDKKKWLLLLVFYLIFLGVSLIADAKLFLCSMIGVFLCEFVSFLIYGKNKIDIPLADIYDVCRNEQKVLIKYHANGSDVMREISITDEHVAEELVNALQSK